MSRLTERRAVNGRDQPMRGAVASGIGAAVNERGVVKSCATSVVARVGWLCYYCARHAVRTVSARVVADDAARRRLARGAAVPARAAPDHASVLILLPGQPGLPAATAIASGIRAALLTEWSFRVTIEMEHVDVARFASPEAEERRLRTVYGSKYGNQRFDVIVAALPEPFQFVLRARDDLWPGTPVVVCGVDERSVGDLKLPPGFAVLTIRFDMKGTVRAALALLPDTRHVALVGGASPPEQVYHDLVRQAVSAVGGLDVIDLTKLPIADVMARVSSLPEHTVIVQSSYQVDGAGRRFHGIDLVPHVSNAANRPVFTPLGLALGRGVVGGSILEFEDIGRDAGMVASRLIRGATPPPAPVPSYARSAPRFDGRQLARWHLDERRLPEDSQVIFRQPTLWQEYGWHVVSAVGLIGAQAALIVTLLVQRQRRREDQAALRQAETAARRHLSQIAQSRPRRRHGPACLIDRARGEPAADGHPRQCAGGEAPAGGAQSRNSRSCDRVSTTSSAMTSERAT